MSKAIEEKNKALVLEAFDTLFNQRDYVAGERYWSPKYIQHSAHIAPGREGLFNLIKSMPPTLKYEPGTIVADGDFVIVHGRFSGIGQLVNWIVADIVRIEDGILVEHWDVIQDEATQEQSKSGLPMFGAKFPERGRVDKDRNQITEPMSKLFRGKNFGYLSTLMKDGSPQVTEIWVDIEDGNIIVNTAEGRLKHKNISRDPRISICVVDQNNPYHMVIVRGKVFEQTNEGAEEHLDKLAKKYLGVDKYPTELRSPDEKRIIVRIKPERATYLTQGPPS
jgi:PPOX class probable F420-dependent enzyme